MTTKLFLTGLALLAVTTLVSAQQGTGKGNCQSKCQSKCSGTGKGTAYVDKNNNGVCDNYESRKDSTSTKKGKGLGKCDGTGNGQGKGTGKAAGKGKNFVDANKNGVCDHAETIKK